MIVHHAGNGWVLEATNAATLQLRTTAGAAFYNYSFIHPSSCVGNTGAMSTTFRSSFAVGDTLQGPLCNDGSVTIVTVQRFNENNATIFHCYRVTNNQNNCQRLY